MIAETVENRPLPRPSWLPESVWPFETFGVDVDGASWRLLMLARDRCFCSSTRAPGRSSGVTS
jgi:hypothetical protein